MHECVWQGMYVCGCTHPCVFVCVFLFIVLNGWCCNPSRGRGHRSGYKVCVLTLVNHPVIELSSSPLLPPHLLCRCCWYKCAKEG